MVKYNLKNKSVTLNLRVSDYGNRVLGIIKEKYGLNDKSQALEKFIAIYGDDFLEREVKDEVIKEMIAEVTKMEKENKKAITFDELDKLCGLKKNV